MLAYVKMVCFDFLGAVARVVPEPVKRPLRRLFGVSRLMDVVCTKCGSELYFHQKWVGLFRENKATVLEYWKTHRFLGEILKICATGQDARILDVGCGISTVLHFVGGEKYGVDPLADQYKRLYKYPQDMNIQTASGERIPFPDCLFHTVFCANVLDHVTSPSGCVNEMHRVLKTSGHLVLTVDLCPQGKKRDRAHPHALGRDDILCLLAGRFEIVFEGQSPFVGLKRYVEGHRDAVDLEGVWVLKKM